MYGHKYAPFMKTGVLCGLFQVTLFEEPSCFLNKIVGSVGLPLSSDMKTFFEGRCDLAVELALACAWKLAYKF